MGRLVVQCREGNHWIISVEPFLLACAALAALDRAKLLEMPVPPD
jgi:hypothetical protein